MAIKPIFNSITRKIELPTIILCNRNKHKLGKISPIYDFSITPDINRTNELSFTVYQKSNGVELELWDSIVDLKVIYIPEYDEYFEISVDVEESDTLVKTITASNLAIAELSQTILYDIEINTEIDIDRQAYKVAKFYDSADVKNSILGRIMAKAPHYSIKHVDDSLCNIVRSFSIDGSSIYDALTGDIAEELHCLIIPNSSDRSISVYDLEDCCRACGYREENIKTCPKCNSTNIKKKYGKETNIFISVDRNAQNVSIDTNKDEIKNTFRIQGGDDEITAAVAGCNPNGSLYITRYNEETLKDMSNELKAKLSEYDVLYNSLQPQYQSAMGVVYDKIDSILNLESKMMPTPVTEESNAAKELSKLTTNNIGNISVQKLSTTGQATANNAVLSVAKILIGKDFKVEVINSEYVTASTVWKGRFRVRNKYDEEDIAENTGNITITINENYENFIKQKINKVLAKEGLTDDTLNDWSLYCLNMLSSFSDAYQSCLDILIEMGVGNPTHEFYESIYCKYYRTKLDIDTEIVIRENDIADETLIKNTYEKTASNIQKRLNIQDFLGATLYNELCSYRREDTYSNDNYVSTGLDNSQILKKAKELFETANKELYKASEIQYTISSTIGNLFALEEYQDIVPQLEVGNWVRVYVDDDVFKLRIIDFTIDDSDFEDLPITFSNAVKVISGVSDMESILSSAKSMASSYSGVARQAEQSEKTTKMANDWVQKGLDATAVAINSSDNQEITFDNHGLLCRRYDDLSGEYSSEQLKLVNNVLAITDNNWESVKAAIGKIFYEDPVTHQMVSAYGVIGETIVGKLLLGEALGIYNDGGSMKFDTNGLEITNDKNVFKVNPNDKSKLFSISKIVDNKEVNILYVNDSGDATFNGRIEANSGYFSGRIEANEGLIGGFSLVDNTLIGKINHTFPDYTSEDIEELNHLIENEDAPSSEQFKKYDINGDVRIDQCDVDLIQRIVNGIDPRTISGKIIINPYSLRDSLIIKKDAYGNEPERIGVRLGYFGGCFKYVYTDTLSCYDLDFYRKDYKSIGYDMYKSGEGEMGVYSGKKLRLASKDGKIHLDSNAILCNSHYLYGIKRSNETEEQNENDIVSLVGIDNDNNSVYGYGSYDKKLGTTSYYGNNTHIHSTNTLTLDSNWITSRRKLKKLWTGSLYMTPEQSIELSEPISKQLNGIVICTSWHDPNSPTLSNGDFAYHFIPKTHIELWEGTDVTISSNHGSYEPHLSSQSLTIYDTSIIGTPENNNSSNNGIKKNSNTIIRAVLGI